MKHGWIPIWRDGRGWQLWTDGEYRGTVAIGLYGRGTVFVPEYHNRVLRFADFKAAAAFVKGLGLL